MANMTFKQVLIGISSWVTNKLQDTPEFVEEDPSQEELVEEYARILAELYQALTDAGAQISATEAIAALAETKAALANTAATNANVKAALAQQAADNANAAATSANTQAQYAYEQGKNAQTIMQSAKGTHPTLSVRLNYIQGLAETTYDLIQVDSDAYINKFNEIVAFLNGITPSETLEGLLADIATQIGAKYTKPTNGIPKTDLESAVQTSLGKADTAYQKPSGGIPKNDLASGVKTSLESADSAYQKPQAGIPSTDMTNEVQTLLGAAGTALQETDIASVAVFVEDNTDTFPFS